MSNDSIEYANFILKHVTDKALERLKKPCGMSDLVAPEFRTPYVPPKITWIQRLKWRFKWKFIDPGLKWFHDKYCTEFCRNDWW